MFYEQGLVLPKPRSDVRGVYFGADRAECCGAVSSLISRPNPEAPCRGLPASLCPLRVWRRLDSSSRGRNSPSSMPRVWGRNCSQSEEGARASLPPSSWGHTLARATLSSVIFFACLCVLVWGGFVLFFVATWFSGPPTPLGRTWSADRLFYPGNGMVVELDVLDITMLNRVEIWCYGRRGFGLSRWWG